MVVVQFGIFNPQFYAPEPAPVAEKPAGVKTPEEIAHNLEETYFQYEEVYALSNVVEEVEREEFMNAAEALEDLESWITQAEPFFSANPTVAKTPLKAQPEKPLPAAPKYETPRIAKGHPEIAIIIDDVGMDRKHSFEVAKMDAPLTLAFLPYAPDLQSVVDTAKAHGHELMIHMPMQAMDSKVSLGSIALREGMSDAEVDVQLDKAFASFDGYKGLNNHMGSRVTQNTSIMRRVMERLKERDLYFVDSKTIGSSVAGDVARAYGLRTSDRDVFLDHVNNIDFVRSALRDVERVADRKGYAIAIGHPKAVTIQGLREWIPDAQARGYTIVFASKLVSRPRAVQSVAQTPEPEVIQFDPAPAPITINSDPLQILSPAPLPE